MKKLIYVLIGLLAFAYACQDDKEDVYVTYPVSVQLVYPAESGFTAEEGVQVRLLNSTTGATFDATTDATGKADFLVPAGIYEASVTDVRVVDVVASILNGLKSNITVAKGTTAPVFEITLTVSKGGRVLIKELYTGGCPKDDGSGTFQMDKYAILYNNSNQVIALDSVAFGTSYPYNSTGSNAYYDSEGHLSYENEGWLPAGTGIWYFTSPVNLEPWTQIVININGAIDNTVTYSQSINYNNPDYYCMYDITTFTNTSYYPTPVNTIPTSHYLKAYQYGAGNAWVISAPCPSFFIFTPKNVSLKSFSTDELYADPASSTSLVRKKLPVDWIVDGVEVFRTGYDDNKKRLTAVVDAGYVYLDSGNGYTVYRNVDKAATEAIEENAGKIVYGYSGGTTDVDGTTDPSGIDAEASIKNGARIVYKDTNNSTNDFHQRKRASLRN